MAKGDWLAIKAALVSGGGLELEHPPGRVMIPSPRHTLAELASAIDIAFAHWDHAHLHAFDFGEQGHYQLGGDEFSPDIRDSVGVHLSDLGVGPGSVFEYVFDLGEDWRHRCEVQETDVDPARYYGSAPEQPVPIWGWGAIPDQYGRLTESGNDE